jgi:hypothetical protein
VIPAPGANAVVRMVFRARFLVARLPKTAIRRASSFVSTLAFSARSSSDGRLFPVLLVEPQGKTVVAVIAREL